MQQPIGVMHGQGVLDVWFRLKFDTHVLYVMLHLAMGLLSLSGICKAVVATTPNMAFHAINSVRRSLVGS